MNTNKQDLKKVLTLVVGLLLLNFASHFFFKRFDLTADKRYTLSQTTLDIIKNVKEPLYIDVYLDGNFPGEFKKLQNETQQILEEYKAYNSNIIFQFENPLEDEEKSESKVKSLFLKGLTPVSVSVDDKGKQSQTMVFPWAIAHYKSKDMNVQLLKNMIGASTSQKVVSSVQHLEYAFTDVIYKLSKAKQKTVAVIKGNGEIQDANIAKFLMQVRESYHIAPFTLDSVAKNPIGTLKALKAYDMAVIAKPTETFTDEEKEVLDQYIVNGGKTLWLIDPVNMEMDSLSKTGTNLAFPRDLNLNDMFFKYGFRLTPDLIKDEQGTPIKLASGEQGSGTQIQEFNWKFAPFIIPEANHPIVKNLGGLKFDFVSPIDTLKNGIKKTILLKSSRDSKKVGVPTEISLAMVSEQSNPAEYTNKGMIPVSVLLEGKFHSMYENRVLPFKTDDFETQGKSSKMIIVSDGDVIKNQLDKNMQPVELGYDQKTGNLFENKEFLLNCVNYLLDDNGLINIRSKEVDLPVLDKDKVAEDYTKSQIITVGVPILLLGIFGFVFTYLRKKKYSK
jgi:gliding-associated putative ABC transporter substrate-binding component GldG